MADWTDYFAQLVGGGATSTDDPMAAGLARPFSPQSPDMEALQRLLSQQAPQGQPPMPTGGDPSMMHGGAAPYRPPSPSSIFEGAFGRSPGQAIQSGLFGAVPPPPIPGPFPQQADPQPQSAPGPAPVRGGAQVLARLYNPEPIPAPGGGDIAQQVNLLGPQSGQYAQFQAAARNAQAAGQPAPPPIPPPMQQQPAAPMAAPQRPEIGANIQRHINKLEAGPDYQPLVAPSTKPDFWQNLTRFGLAAMAAGGKPGATTLGALGEAGLSTVDQNQKAKQGDFENTIAARKLGITGQHYISQAYERLDALKQRSEDTRLSIEQRAEAARQARELQLQIATMTNQLGRDRLDENARGNDIREGEAASRAADREDKTADRRAAEQRRIDDLGRQTQRDTDTQEQHLIGQQKADTMNTLGKTSAQLKYERWSQLDPESRQGKAYQAWEAKRADTVAQAQRAIASGRPKAAVNKQLQDLGYDPLP